MTCAVTFDTEVFQRVVWPHRFPGDPESEAFGEINAALAAGKIRGFIADPIANIEQIPKRNRPAYFGGLQAVVAGSETVLPDGTIKLSYAIKPDPTAHPGLPGILVDCIRNALTLGFRILRCPRIALPPAPELQQDWYADDANEQEQG